MFFAKYDLDGDGIFSLDEGANIVNDLDMDNIDRDVSDIYFYLLIYLSIYILKYLSTWMKGLKTISL